MALAHDAWHDAGPIPPELMDEPEGASEALAAIEAAFGLAESAEVSLAQAVVMIADAEPQGWRVRSDEDAEWAGRHLAEATAELEALRERAARWQERIEAWFVQAAREPAKAAEFWTAHLDWFAREQREAGRKSVKLPSVKLSTRSTAACAEVADEEALVAWALATWDEGGTVAPPQPRKAYVGELRKLTRVVEVIDRARLVLAGGEVIQWVRWQGEEPPPDLDPGCVAGERCPSVGDGWPSPEDAEDLVGQVEVLASHAEVHDAYGAAVPGVTVRPEHISVTVEPVL